MKDLKEIVSDAIRSSGFVAGELIAPIAADVVRALEEVEACPIQRMRLDALENAALYVLTLPDRHIPIEQLDRIKYRLEEVIHKPVAVLPYGAKLEVVKEIKQRHDRQAEAKAILDLSYHLYKTSDLQTNGILAVEQVKLSHELAKIAHKIAHNWEEFHHVS